MESEVKSAALWLGKLIVEEMKYLGAVTGKVKILQTELNTLSAFLTDAALRSRRHKNVVRTTLLEAKNIAFDCEDVIETYILRVARHGYEDYEGFRLGSIKRWGCLIWKTVDVHGIHSEIDDLNGRFSALKSCMTSYGVSDRIVAAEINPSLYQTEPLTQVYPHEISEVAVGLENHLEKLVPRLLDSDDRTVITVCGMGGIGKSTLARELYNHPRLRDNCFLAFGWAHASRRCQPDRVLRTLLDSLVPENDRERRARVAKHVDADGAHVALYNLMIADKCLVVIDDIWTREDWDRIRAAFPINVENAKSRILLTTRNKDILSGLNPTQVLLHPVEGLDETKSWELFENTIFPDAMNTETRRRGSSFSFLTQASAFLRFPLSAALQIFRRAASTVHLYKSPESDVDSVVVLDSAKKELGLEMLRHCKGVPLAIVCLAKVLRRKKSIEDWIQMRNDISAQIRGGGIPNLVYKELHDVLQVSYDELPYHLKNCFLHLANFPEDYEIPTEKLYQLWVCEGIVSKEYPNELEEDIAERYLKELVSRSMVQVVSFVEGTTERIAKCRLHDLMRDVCIEITKREDFLHLINCEGPLLLSNQRKGDNLLMTLLPQRDKRLRRIAVYVSDQEPQTSTLHPTTLTSTAKVSRAPNLRSLLLFSSNYEHRGEENWRKFVETVSNDFPLLGVLDCENFRIHGKLHKKVGNLIHLRYLGLANTRVTELPSSIENMQWLQTLDLRVDHDVVLSLPNILWKMKQLRHLYLPYYGALELVEQDRIAGVLQRYVVKGGGLLRLGGLSNLQTLVHIDLDRVQSSELNRLKMVSATCETNNEALDRLLRGSSSTLKTFTLKVHARIISENPEILSSCKAMCYLDIHAQRNGSFRLRRSPGLDIMLPQSLVYLGIWYLKLEADPLSVLGKLPNLVRLGLRMCYDDRTMVCSAGGFPKLIDLFFDGLFHFRSWEIEQGALQKLESLLIINCPVGITTPLPALPSSVNVRTHYDIPRCRLME